MTKRKAKNLLSKTLKFFDDMSALFKTNPPAHREILLICYTIQRFVKTAKHYGFNGSFYDPNVLQKLFYFLEQKLDILSISHSRQYSQTKGVLSC